MRWPASARSIVKSSPLRLRLASPHSTSGRSIRSLVTSRRSSTPKGTVPGDNAIAIGRGGVPSSKNPRPSSVRCDQGGGLPLLLRRLATRRGVRKQTLKNRITQREKVRGLLWRFVREPNCPNQLDREERRGQGVFVDFGWRAKKRRDRSVPILSARPRNAVQIRTARLRARFSLQKNSDSVFSRALGASAPSPTPSTRAG